MVDIGLLIEHLSKFAGLFDRSEFRRGVARTATADEAEVISRLLEVSANEEASEAFSAELALLELDETLADERFEHAVPGALANAGH